jgi:3-oxoacyl-[acyl-carrier protein] reductase
MMFGLKGKRALVTGASGGIGAEIARVLVKSGAMVALAGTRESALQALASEIGEAARPVVGNLAEPSGADSLIKGAEAALGGIDILVNNAGITRDQLMLRMRDEDWSAVLELDLTAAFRLSRGCLRGMLKNRWGRIVNVTSVVGSTGNPGQVNYAAAKAGLAGMSRALAAEVASRNVTVNCVAPGFIDTPMTASLAADQREKLLQRIPCGRLGMPKEVAACVLFLASEEASYITGHSLHVNGGMAMI